MTLLSDSELIKFKDFYDKKQWKQVAAFGEELLKKDPRDGKAIRFGVIDAYAILSDADGAESLARRYCEYADEGEDYDPFVYRSAQEITDGWSDKQKETWLETIDNSMKFQLAMAYWNSRDDSRIEDAKKLISSMPEFLDEYLAMDEVGIEREKEEHLFRYKPGTVDELHIFVGVPYDDQVEFRNWIEREGLR